MNCRVLGKGTKIMVAFHGFGQDGDVSRNLSFHGMDLTIYSFDLPFHGDTKIKNYLKPLDANELQEIMMRLIEITSIGRFSLLGYSIGVKLVFPLLEKFQKNISEIWLLAPDGITPNFWYNIATGTSSMRFLFQNVLQTPSIVRVTGRLFRLIGLIDQTTLQFILRSIETEKKRSQVYKTWTYLRKLKPHIGELALTLNRQKIPVYFVIGKSDKIINKSRIIPLESKLEEAEIIELSSGHQNLIKKFADWYSINSE